MESVSEKSPDAFRTISEAASDLGVPQHVLRFWETRFSQIKPMKRGGGRRYYRPHDVDLLRGIRFLLYDRGYTIKGVQRILKEQGVRFVQSVWRSDIAEADSASEAEGALAPRPVKSVAAVAKPTPAEAVAPLQPAAPQAVEMQVRAAPPPKPECATPVVTIPPQDAPALSPKDVSILKSALDTLRDCRDGLEAARAAADS